MPRPKTRLPALPDRFPLPTRTTRSLAVLIGCDELPAQCRTELEELLAAHLRAAHADGERKGETSPDRVEAAIARATAAVRQLTRLDTGIDAETYRILKPRAEAFILAAEERLAELSGSPRSPPLQDPLRLTGPFLRKIFERHVSQGFNTRGNLRSFAFIALHAANIVASSVDEADLDLLDEYLDAEPLPLG
jgi:hypothetical protein